MVEKRTLKVLFCSLAVLVVFGVWRISPAEAQQFEEHQVFLPQVFKGTSTQNQLRDPIDGSQADCTNFILSIVGIDVNIPDPGWVWVDTAQTFRDVSGVVTKSEVTHTDFPAVHDSHDQNTLILVDPGQEDILSDVNKPNNEDPVADAGELLEPTTLELEWEIGTFPSERGKNVPERFFPKWAWPNNGDRVWANGHWIFDCGHGKDVGGVTHHRTEIHPARAIASMRDQVRVLPGTGTTPVPVTATDLYIHGRAGFVVDILNCGMDIIIASDPDFCPTKTTPIDENFEFDIHLPPKPSPSAVLATFVEDGPGNTVDVAPILEPMPVDDPDSIHVTIPLEGSGVDPEDVYARRIFAGWVFPPDPPLRHFQLTLNQMDLHEDHETDPGDCECTFFWMNVDRSPENEWIKLVDFATGNMNDYDDDGGLLGDGEMDFEGAVFDFYVRNDQTFNVRAHGYDQDCLDDQFGDHSFEISTFLDCYLLAAFEFNAGDNDDFAALEATFGPPDYGVGSQDVTASGEYELEFTIEEIPLTEAEDTADLRLDKICKPDDIGLVGETITCTIFVDNLGPGLPRDVILEDTLVTDVASDDYSLGTPTFTFGNGFIGTPTPCDVTPPNQFTCELETVPVGGRAIVTVTIESDEGGDFNNEAHVSTDSTDPDLTNNHDVDGLTVIPAADLSIGQIGDPNPVVAGEQLTYTLTITNSGPSLATNVVVEDVLPAGVSIDSINTVADGSCNAGEPGDPSLPSRCFFDSLAPSDTEQMIIVVTIKPQTSGILHNDAQVSSDTVDTNNANDLSVEETTVEAHADLEVAHSDFPDPVVAGEQLKYEVRITNNGPSTARDVNLEEALPAEGSFIGATISNGEGICALLAIPPNTVSCELNDLDPGEFVIVFISFEVDSSVPEGSTIESSAAVSTSALDTDPANSTQPVETAVEAVADLEITKTSDADVYKPSSTVQYTVEVVNHGPSDAVDVVVTDNLPEVKQAIYEFDTADCVKTDLTLTCDLDTIPAGESVSFNVYVQVKGNKGEVSNTASVTSATFDPDDENNTSTWVVLIEGGISSTTIAHMLIESYAYALIVK